MADPWFKFFPSDWLGGTSGMTAAERGVYITLVAMIYDAAAPIRRDDARLARRCGITKASWLKIIETLIDEGKITVTADGGLTNDRCEIELSARVNRVESATVASAKAAQARSVKSEQYQRDYSPPDDPTDTAEPPKPEARSHIDNGGGGSACVRDADPTLRERILIACGVDPVSGLTGPNGNTLGSRVDMDQVARWQADLSLDPETIVAVVSEAMSGKRDGPPSRFTYFDKAMARESARRAAPPLRPSENTTSASAGRPSGHGIKAQLPEKYRQ